MKPTNIFITLLANVTASTTQAQDFNEIIKAVASDRESGDQFGWSVSISSNYAMVGARFEEGVAEGNTFDAGSAYIFERDGSGKWNEAQKIVASDRGAGDWFGNSVAISENYAIVGAFLESEDAAGGNTLPNAGSAYIFEIGLFNNRNRYTSCL